MKAFLIVLSLLALLAIGVIGMGGALGPLAFAFFLAYFLFPLIQRLEKRGIPRGLAVTGVTVLFLGVSAGVIALIGPGLVKDTRHFLHELPQNALRAADKAEQIAQKFGYTLDLREQGVRELLEENVSLLSADFVKSAGRMVRGVFSNLTQWFLALLNLFLIPLFFFYVINDYEKISEGIKSFVPKPLRPKMRHYVNLANTVLSGYIRGQFSVAAILAILYGGGLWLIGLRFGFVIGLASGLLSIIPYVGFSLGFATALMMALANFTGMNTVLGVMLVFAIVQALESFLITPTLVGDKVGLSAFATVLALIVGGNLFGLVGMLIAIPVAAILKWVIADLKTQYQALDLYNR